MAASPDPSLDLARLAAALARHEPRREPSVPDGRKAAVAAVARDGAAGAELLFIRRAEHPRDPWSGQMGLPGGRVDPGDAGPLATAIRETREELALDLAAAGRLLGALSEARTHLRLGRSPYSVAPFVFAIAGDPAFAPSAEVQEALWVPLAFLADPARRDSLTWVRRGVPLPMPCCRFEGRPIWGLTLRIVDELLAVAAQNAPAKSTR
ncbi:MAG: CoA pyrophosphatase [Thermoanaerobaculia bacterium]|nr:CoA pyrophosphatase [Thermoanaerobaculia bacterium]